MVSTEERIRSLENRLRLLQKLPPLEQGRVHLSGVHLHRSVEDSDHRHTASADEAHREEAVAEAVSEGAQPPTALSGTNHAETSAKQPLQTAVVDPATPHRQRSEDSVQAPAKGKVYKMKNIVHATNEKEGKKRNPHVRYSSGIAAKVRTPPAAAHADSGPSHNSSTKRAFRLVLRPRVPVRSEASSPPDSPPGGAADEENSSLVSKMTLFSNVFHYSGKDLSPLSLPLQSLYFSKKQEGGHLRRVPESSKAAVVRRPSNVQTRRASAKDLSSVKKTTERLPQAVPAELSQAPSILPTAPRAALSDAPTPGSQRASTTSSLPLPFDDALSGSAEKRSTPALPPCGSPLLRCVAKNSENEVLLPLHSSVEEVEEEEVKKSRSSTQISTAAVALASQPHSVTTSGPASPPTASSSYMKMRLGFGGTSQHTPSFMGSVQSVLSNLDAAGSIEEEKLSQHRRVTSAKGEVRSDMTGLPNSTRPPLYPTKTASSTAAMEKHQRQNALFPRSIRTPQADKETKARSAPIKQRPPTADALPPSSTRTPLLPSHPFDQTFTALAASKKPLERPQIFATHKRPSSGKARTLPNEVGIPKQAPSTSFDPTPKEKQPPVAAVEDPLVEPPAWLEDERASKDPLLLQYDSPVSKKEYALLMEVYGSYLDGTEEGLVDLWVNGLGGTQQWQRHLRPNQLTLLLSKETELMKGRFRVGKDWLSYLGGARVEASEITGFFSNMLSRMPCLEFIELFDCQRNPFDWSSITDAGEKAFAQLKGIYFLYTTWTSSDVMQLVQLCPKLERGKVRTDAFLQCVNGTTVESLELESGGKLVVKAY